MGAESSPRPPGSFRALGGRLLLDSFPTMGREAVESYLSRAELRIRRAAEARPPSSQSAMTNPSVRSGPVSLVVDDEEDLQDIMRRMLQRRGFQTFSASTADEALQVCRDHPGVIDFMVADLGLPGVTNREFRSALAASQPNLRIVFISGLPREVAVLHGLITADDILMKKPFSPENLIAALHTAAESSARRAT